MKTMKTIGIIGGMSAESTVLYYQTLIQQTRTHLGGLHSPDLLIRSLDFAPIAALQAADKWDEASEILNAAARDLQRGGAQVLVLATNTMHRVWEGVIGGVGEEIRLCHIGDAVAGRIRGWGGGGGANSEVQGGLRRPGLMATRFTMEQAFYLDRLRAVELDPVVPGPEDRRTVHRIIYDELCKGIVTEESKETYVAIAKRLVEEQGADCLILGCTEVGMLLGPEDVSVPVFDSLVVHCEEALRMALEE